VRGEGIDDSAIDRRCNVELVNPPAVRHNPAVPWRSPLSDLSACDPERLARLEHHGRAELDRDSIVQSYKFKVQSLPIAE
jgi:hypothetical protein